MKALAVKQPWAYLICAGVKDIENRTWKCPEKYIGQRVLIHASSKGRFDFEGLNIEQFDKIVRLSTHSFNHFQSELHSSAIIGSVEIIDCVQNHPSIWAEKDVYNWVLANPILFPKPIPAKGKLSFWEFHEIGEVIIKCPKCGAHEIALENYTTIPFPTYLHECSECGYMIMESEWDVLK